MYLRAYPHDSDDLEVLRRPFLVPIDSLPPRASP
jgi:hypothetical protein